MAISQQIRNLIFNAHKDDCVCMLASIGEDGPNISPKGSMIVLDDDHLAYWERAKRSALQNVGENPNVVIYYNHQANRLRWRFHGNATVYEDGPIRQEVMDRCVQAELDRDPERLGVAVLVKIDKITELSGNVLQERD